MAWWYRQNTLLFADAQARAAYPALVGLSPAPGTSLDQVHPENYAAKAQAWHSAMANLEQLRTFLSSGSSFEVTRTADGQVTVDKRR